MNQVENKKGIASDLYLDESLEAQLYFAAVRRQSEPLGELRYHAQIDYDVPVLTVRVHPFVSDFKIGLKPKCTAIKFRPISHSLLVWT